MRFSIAFLAIAAAAFVTVSTSAHNDEHYRASHSVHHRTQLVHNSRCGGPVYVSTWRPEHRLYRSGFVHFSQPTIVSQPVIFSSSRGYRSSLGGFVHVSSRNAYRGSVCSYNGSIGSNNAHQRQINWNKRAQVHGCKVTVHEKGD